MNHFVQIIHFASLTGMRAGEIFNLTWDKVDLKGRAIRLEAADTKTFDPRVICLNHEVLGLVTAAGKIRSLSHDRVFTYKGHPMASINTCFRRAVGQPALPTFGSMICAIPSTPT